MKMTGQVDKSRRDFLKAAAVAASTSAVSFVAVSRDELKKMLVPVNLSDFIAEAAEAGSPLERRAREREARLKEWCRAEADKICSSMGEDSDACREARKRCAMIKVKGTGPREGVRFAMALDVNKCIGCRRCAYACVMENNQGRNLGIEWIKVLEMPREEMEVIYANMDYTEAPKPNMVYVPVACMHCEDPPCTMVCPVRATWKEPDGIVVVDYDRCIGCRYCMTACPYGARRFNWAKPYVPVTELNPNMHILGNVPRQVHVVEKCTWCIQRTRDGGVPACVEVCPVGARVFGDLNDPDSPIRRVIEEYGAFVLKPEAGTRPRFFYFFGPKRTPPREPGAEAKE
ncbi:hypothetical protein PABY_02380 [Pyrodictium abyssi]|uniref:4Fe-4S ferredoxin-type domain-containing protein n=2 Tax=Pyrodictium abyssi TaxID=54256 RepID=A0ABM8ISX3_9CREN|nr:hypothetical protein PABY_02380 [Pyrodictium abyssi]